MPSAKPIPNHQRAPPPPAEASQGSGPAREGGARHVTRISAGRAGGPPQPKSRAPRASNSVEGGGHGVLGLGQQQEDADGDVPKISQLVRKCKDLQPVQMEVLRIHCERLRKALMIRKDAVKAQITTLREKVKKMLTPFALGFR